jgi:hypothetical protein
MYHGLERSTVALVGFSNSPASVQRFIDRVLRHFKDFCCAFVDDTVIFSSSDEEH